MEKTKELAEQLLVNALIFYQQSDRIKALGKWQYSDDETLKIAIKAIEDGAELNGKIAYPFGGDVPYLQVATDKQMWSVAKKMIDYGVNVNEINFQGTNSLHNLFIYFYYFELCKDRDEARAVMVKMLQHGAFTSGIADMVTKDPYGQELLSDLIKDAAIKK